MKDRWFGLMLTLFTVGCLFVFFGPFLFSQMPPTIFPDHDVAYSCNPVLGTGAPFQLRFTNFPAPHFDVAVGNVPASTDSMNPIILSVTTTSGIDVTSGNVKLLAANNGLSITVTATDNIGVVGGRLDVDGKLGTPFGSGTDILPSTFYVRWNAKTITAGAHTFRLTVWDSNQNQAERTWGMTK
jgi:hypothetical protein